MEDKETFDTVASNYDKYRPEYPNELFVDIVNYSNLQSEANILEIGCGTGQATGGLVNNGFQNITCVELGTHLAQITSNKFKDYSSVQVVRSSFEDWQGLDESYDLAISATAFHFIEPKFGYQKVSRLLKNKGTMGFFWTVHVPQYDEIHTETLVQALKRECKEDLGVAIIESNLLCIREYISRNHEYSFIMKEVHSIDFIYACNIKPIITDLKSVQSDIGQIGIEWLPINKIQETLVQANESLRPYKFPRTLHEFYEEYFLNQIIEPYKSIVFEG